VRVTMDGQPLVDKLDGTAIAIDPGLHRFLFEADDMARTERTLVVREGDKGRRERVVLNRVLSLPAQESVPRGSGEPSSTRRGIPTLAYVAAGAGALGLAVGIGTGVAAADKHAVLKDECTPYPNCPSTAQSDLSSFHSLRDWSTVGYVVGAVGLLGGVALWLWLPQTRSDSPTAHLWIGPASAGIAGTF